MQIPIFFALLAFSAIAAPSRATADDSVYDPCHLLCANEQGRSELRLIPGNELPREFHYGYRVETTYLKPSGRYETNNFVPIAGNAKVDVIEVLPSLWYRPTPNYQFNFLIPLEWNQTENVVLPSLHPVPGRHTETNPGGILASAHMRLHFSEDPQFEAWGGVGYKLSKPSGTTDVSQDAGPHPDARIEALGVGSDDVYFVYREGYYPTQMPQWSFGMGTELRFHILPRFERWFGTTLDYQLWARRSLGSDWSASLRLSGFYTRVRSVAITQRSAFIFSPELGYRLNGQTDLIASVTGELPERSLNENVLQTWGIGVSLVFHR